MNAATRDVIIVNLRECCSLEEGRSIHRKIAHSRHLGQDVFVMNLVLQMYGSCGSVGDAKSTFDAMLIRNVFSWNIMIAAYAKNGHCREAIVLFWQMPCEPSKVTFVNVLAACAGLGDLSDLEAVHKRINQLQCEEVVLGTALMNSYSKCGSLEAARSVFARLRSRDSVSFNAMIAAAAQHAEFGLALFFFRRMQLEGLRATSATFLSFAALCTDPDIAKNIHEQALASCLGSDVATMNSLVTMYGNCRSCEKSWEVFSAMRVWDVISWNAMIEAFSHCGQSSRAIQLSRIMDLEGIKFVDVTFVLVLCALNEQAPPAMRKLVHARVVESGYRDNPVVANALLSMHGRCGELGLAVEVFDRLRDPGLPTYNALITQYVQHGRAVEALDLYKKMALEPNKVTLINVVEACSQLESLEDGRDVHARIAALDLESDLVIGTLLVNMYGICGSVEEARSSFAKVKLAGQRGELSAWNAMAGALAQNDQPRDAMRMLREMDIQGVRADEVSFITFLGACEDLERVRELHGRIIACGLDRDVVVATAIVSMYARFGAMEGAMVMFEKIEERDVVAWNAMVSGYAEIGHLEDGMHFVRKMEIEGMRPDESVMATLAGSCQNSAQAHRIHHFINCCYMEEMDPSYEWIEVALIHMFAKAGCLSNAREVFDSMTKESKRSTTTSLVVWNSMLAAYARCHRSREALLLFTEVLQRGLDPDGTTFACLLSALTHSGLLERARDCFLDMVAEFSIAAAFEHYGCMIDLLGRCGRLQQATDLMNSMPFEPDSTGWTSLLSASTIHPHRAIAATSASLAAKLDPSNSAPYVLLSNAIRRDYS